MSEGGIDIAGRRVVVTGTSELCALARRRLGPFWHEWPTDPTARTLELRTPAEGPAPEGASPITMADGTLLGWFRPTPAGGEVTVAAPSAIEGGLRLVLARSLPDDRYLMVHGAALRVGGRAVVAVGNSGAGKSTLTTLFTEAESMSDETVILEASDPPRVHATFMRSNTPRPPIPGTAEVGAVLALEKRPAAALRPLKAARAVELILSQTLAPDGRALAAQLFVASSIVGRTAHRTLEFAKDRTFVPLLTELLGR